MNKNPAKKKIEEFFKKLKIENSYYSLQLNQPVLLIGEQNLYLAVKELLEQENTQNTERYFKQLPSSNKLFL